MAVVSKLSAEERRSVTVEAVLKLAEKHNPSEITTAAIAQHMHLTQGALFRHFPNKDAIWQAVMGWVSERLIARLDAASRTATPSLDALDAMFIAHTSFAADHPGALRILLGELQREMDTPAKRTARVLFTRYGELLRSVIEQGKSRGDLDPGTDTAAAVALFIGMVQGLVLQSLLAGDVLHIRAHAPGVFAIYRRGLEKT